MAVWFRHKRVVFYELPRTGSTSARKCLIDAGGIPYDKHGECWEADRCRKSVSFSAVRNPFDLLASWWLKSPPGPSFSDWLRSPPPTPTFSRNGRLLYLQTDHFVRFENLIVEFRKKCHELGLGIRKVGHLNATPGKQPYQNYYTQDDVDYVTATYADDLAQFNYTFEVA